MKITVGDSLITTLQNDFGFDHRQRHKVQVKTDIQVSPYTNLPTFLLSITFQLIATYFYR